MCRSTEVMERVNQGTSESGWRTASSVSSAVFIASSLARNELCDASRTNIVYRNNSVLDQYRFLGRCDRDPLCGSVPEKLSEVDLAKPTGNEWEDSKAHRWADVDAAKPEPKASTG